MKLFKTAALGLCIVALSGGAAFAQDAMMKSDSMMKPMSKKDMKMMKKCQGMDHDMMMKSSGCMKMMKMHPDMMKDDGMMKH